MNILNIATILPYKNRNTNDIIIKNSEYINYFSNDKYNFKYLTLLPYSNKILSMFNDKWKKYNDYPEKYYYKDNKIEGLKGIRFPNSIFMNLSCLSYVLMNRNKIKNLIKDINIVHAHYLFPDGFIAYYIFKKYKIPYVITIRKNGAKWLKKSIFLNKIGKRILTNASEVTSVNIVDKNKVNNIVNENITVIPHSVSKEEFFQKFEVSKPINIVTVSHYQKRKRLDLIIKALAKLDKKGYNNRYTYTLVGKNKEGLNLKDLADKLGVKVNFTGKLSYKKTQNLLNKSDLFVLVSVNETFGRVYSEAISKSNATIATKNTGIYGFFNNNEVKYVKENDLDDLYYNLKELLDNKEKIEEMKMKSYNKAKNIFLLENNINKYIKIYNKLSSKT